MQSEQLFRCNNQRRAEYGRHECVAGPEDASAEEHTDEQHADECAMKTEFDWRQRLDQIGNRQGGHAYFENESVTILRVHAMHTTDAPCLAGVRTHAAVCRLNE
jgi:hypothetical protein